VRPGRPKQGYISWNVIETLLFLLSLKIVVAGRYDFVALSGYTSARVAPEW
jgi:hypothetical protein